MTFTRMFAALAFILSTFFIGSTTVHAAGVSLFNDGFETNPNPFALWTSADTPSDGKWGTDSSGQHAGAFSARVIGSTGSSDDVIRKAISTVGQTSVTLSYWYKADNLEEGDDLRAEYSTNGGSNWTLLYKIDNDEDDSVWRTNSHSLPLLAVNNANFQFRFRADLDSGNDKIWLDDVVLEVAGPENTLSLCTDTLDNDGDASTDLSDIDCQGYLPTITVNKVAIGGPKTASEFSLSVCADGAVPPSESCEPVLTGISEAMLPGNYHVREVSDANYQMAITGGNCQSDGSITLNAGQAYTCEVTNTFIGGECEDGLDNDGNGQTDYPNDLGCSSSDDSDEAPVIIVEPQVCPEGTTGLWPVCIQIPESDPCDVNEEENILFSVLNNECNPSLECPEGTIGQFPACFPEEIDRCDNIEGLQVLIPKGYTESERICNPVSSARIVATKIICDVEADLPNWGAGSNVTINADTASNWVHSHESCRFAEGWKFQYATEYTYNPGDAFINMAGSPWVTALPATDAQGMTSWEIALQEWTDVISIREVLLDGYIPFSHEGNPDNSNDFSAEIYCSDDVYNYDNLDYIVDPEAGETYYCVAWNVQKPTVQEIPPYCGDGIVNQEWEQCDVAGSNELDRTSQSCTDQCRVPSDMCTNDVFARVVVTDVQNWNGGDATSNVFVGQNMTSIPQGTWFPVRLGWTTIVDSSIEGYEDVPGLAVERTYAGVRVRIHGSHNDESNAKEHIEGYVEFWNATPLAQWHDAGQNKPENPSNGTQTLNPGNDETWLSGGQSHFWFTVTGADDGFKTPYEVTYCQDQNDLCDNLEGSQSEVPEGYVLEGEGQCLLVDRCSNLKGVQEGIPEGYVQFEDQCVPEEEENSDYCSNIEGNQSEVPEGYYEYEGYCYADEDGEEEGDTDLCANIEGTQVTLPEGYVANGNQCTIPDARIGGGSNGGTSAPACADGSDNDGDSKADYPQDLGCESSLDNDESGDGSVFALSSGGSTTTATSTGDVLGAATEEPALPVQCSEYITDDMKMGKKNDVEQVKKLQTFLNKVMGTTLPVNGFFGSMTRNTVKKFQKQYSNEILQPWIDAGFPVSGLKDGTGYVYKTTKRWINMMECQSLALPLPELKVGE